ncbi:MAG: sigma-70 family RNA polymerase sigma factor [Bacteroidota bacterium]
MSASDAAVLKYKPLLMAIATEMTGNFKDAEDAVQDTFLKWFERDTSHVTRIKPYLIATLKNTCFDWFKQAQRLTEYKNEWWEEYMQTQNDYSSYWPEFDMEWELSKAYASLTSKLNISEKAVFLLREIFNFDYQDIATIVDKKSENCRKILDRAKKRLAENNERFREEADKTYQNSFYYFQMACDSDKLHEFVTYLSKELKDKLGQ